MMDNPIFFATLLFMQERILEGFRGQRLVVLPATVISRCRTLPVVDQIHVTHIGSYPCAPHHYVERPEGVPQAILLYCMEGSGTLEQAGRDILIERGHAAIIPPGTPHIYRASTKTPWSIFWIHFEGRQVDLILREMKIESGNPLLHVPDTSMMHQAFEEVFTCLGHHFSNAGLLAMSGELVHLLAKLQLHRTRSLYTLHAHEDRVMDSIDFMQRHLTMPLSLADLAAHSRQSIPHYCKLFKARISQSPMAYFTQLKMRKACELLDQTNLTIKEIADMLGYDDPYYFSRLFKKVQGDSPSQYRQFH